MKNKDGNEGEEKPSEVKPSREAPRGTPFRGRVVRPISRPVSRAPLQENRNAEGTKTPLASENTVVENNESSKIQRIEPASDIFNADIPNAGVNGFSYIRGLRQNVPAFYQGRIEVSDWSSSPNGHSLKIVILDSDGVHPFKGLTAYKKEGRRVFSAGQRIHIFVIASDMSVTYDGQAIVTWWGDDSKNGMTASLKIDDGADLGNNHPFCNVKTKYYTGYQNRHGDILEMMSWVVDDNENFVRPSKTFQEMSEVRQAQIKCRLDKDFQEFCVDNMAFLSDMSGVQISSMVLANRASATTAQDITAVIVRSFCGIESRKELSENSRSGFDARMKWRLLLSLYDNRAR